MERKPYSAGAVKFSFWFMEFRKTVQLLSEGKSFADIKKLNEETNIYGAPTKLRAQQIYSTVTARIKTFVLGAVLITTVLTVPGFHNLFKVETLNLMQLGCVYLYAFASLLIIQLLKCIRMKLRKRGER